MNLTDSGTTLATRDRITDFRKGEDKIDLSGIDANGSLMADQAFNALIGPTARFTQPGQMKINHNGNHNFTVFLNTNTDLLPESTIDVQLVGVGPNIPVSLALTDFVL